MESYIYIYIWAFYAAYYVDTISPNKIDRSYLDLCVCGLCVKSDSLIYLMMIDTTVALVIILYYSVM